MNEQNLVNNVCSLPRQCPKKELEKMGVKFLSNIDDLLVSVILPNGWRKKSTGHSMWEYLLNEKGEKIASIFFKGIPYDRCSFLRLEPGI